MTRPRSGQTKAHQVRQRMSGREEAVTGSSEKWKMSSWSREASGQVGLNRRNFLRSAVGMGVGSAMFSFAPARALAMAPDQKVIVVTFGGGARDEETFAPEGQQNIPCLLNELIPRSTFFTQVVNHGILGHYVATASLATGIYESFDNFATVPPPHPTVFEYYRKELHKPARDAWVVAPSNGFNRIGASDASGYGPRMGAGVILPKHLLKAALTQQHAGQFAHLLQDNYETPYYTPAISGNPFQLAQLEKVLRMSVSDFVGHARNLASPDELSVFVVRQLMKQLAPSLLWVTLHDMDVAHAGAYSLYQDGIQRTDRLCGELWKAVQTNPEYAGKTTMFILPDFGRDADGDPGGNGFQHHRTGDPLSRTTWMMVLGPGVRENVSVNRPVQSLDLVPTLGARLGFSPTMAQGKVLTEVV